MSVKLNKYSSKINKPKETINLNRITLKKNKDQIAKTTKNNNKELIKVGQELEEIYSTYSFISDVSLKSAFSLDQQIK